MGNIFALALVSFVLLTKAALERWHFQDRNDAKRTLFLFCVSAGSIAFALCISLFIDYCG